MSYSDYRRIKQLGEGGNGWVYLVLDNSKNEFAVKVSKIEEVTGNFTKLKLERFKTEAIKVHELSREGQEGIHRKLIHLLLSYRSSLRGEFLFHRFIGFTEEEIIRFESYRDKEIDVANFVWNYAIWFDGEKFIVA